jgi:hypothetical protein
VSGDTNSGLMGTGTVTHGLNMGNSLCFQSSFAMDSPKIDNEVYRMTVEPSRTSDEWRIVTYFKKIHTPVRFYVNDHFVFTISKCMAKILRS